VKILNQIDISAFIDGENELGEAKVTCNINFQNKNTCGYILVSIVAEPNTQSRTLLMNLNMMFLHYKYGIMPIMLNITGHGWLWKFYTRI